MDGVDSVANDIIEVMLLCDKTTLVNPECHEIRANPVDRHLKMDCCFLGSGTTRTLPGHRDASFK